MEWPEFFPEGCPPQNAISASGLVYRLISEKKLIPLNHKHFQSHREKQPFRVWVNIPECCLCSVSVCADYNDAIKLKTTLSNQIPAKGKKQMFITEGILTPDLGKMLHTPDKENGLESHHDWWIPKEQDPSQKFQYSAIHDGGE